MAKKKVHIGRKVGQKAVTGEQMDKATFPKSEAIEELTRQRDVAIKHIAEWCVAIETNGSGWDDWDEYYKDAIHRTLALPEIRDLLVNAIEVARKTRASC
jgi:hypothetical protein